MTQFIMLSTLCSSTRDEEPLVDARIDWCRCQVLILWDMRELVWADAALRLLDSEVGSRNITRIGLASDQLLPRLSALTNNISCILLILALSSESKLVLWLSIWDLVDSEPFICSPQQAWKVSLNVLDIVELGCQWVVDIDNNDLPVGFLPHQAKP